MADKFNRRSVATIDSPEFINITSISPLVSKCEVKVLYVGENRNRSFITKEVATEMAQTLCGCPIVGYFIENKEDFGDHGDQVIIDGEGVKFKKLTKPYGFVAPDSKVWFQKFNDTDEFGQTVVREYLMTEGYLWTGQYEECKRVMQNGNPQSMELDEKSLKGYWSTDYNRGIDFFIINDAMFSKLCILGEDVEPCFEGADVTAPKISSSFSRDDGFVRTLFSMMEELKNTLNDSKGGYSMADMENISEVVDNSVEETQLENYSTIEGTPEIQFEDASESGEGETPASDDAASETEGTGDTSDAEEGTTTSGAGSTESDPPAEEVIESDVPEKVKKVFKKAEEEETDDKEKSSDDSEEEKKDAPKDEEEDDKKKKSDKEEFACGDDEKKKYQLELEELQNKYALLEAENVELRNFKNSIESQQKDELISSFYMLSDEDKKDVIEHKAEYSLDDIEAKLSVICVRKKVNFSNDAQEQPAPMTYNLEGAETSNLPAWLRAVEATKKML